MTYAVASLGSVTHDGITYHEGQEIPGLTPEQADALLACGVITHTQDASSKPSGRATDK